MANRTLHKKLAAAAAGALAATLLSGLGVAASAGTPDARSQLPQLDEPVHLDPADFSADIDNRRWPMTVGSRWVYRVTDSADRSRKRDVIKVTGRTKLMGDGIEARVVRDVVTDHGKPTEVTEDWYAQDAHGNVWYFGEDTTAYRHGRAVDNGSWEAGVDGAMPGIALPAHPKVGMTYREEYSKGEAEDQSRVIRLDAQAEVPAGHYKDVLMTEDFSPIEPKVSELKFYAKGSGQAVLAVDVSGGSEREELVEYTH
ncbi:MAG: hypothetical protein QOI10_5 [Solirubrobacterales bacterium]|jgi:hypothetical protein|nr:hypothetical protein [Solirubrobacterales bacterium]